MYISLKRALSLIFTLIILSSSNLLTVNASAAQTEGIGRVSMGTIGSITLTNLQLMPFKNEQILTATINFENKGNTEIAFVDYWIKIMLKNNGIVLSPSLIGLDESKNKIMPGTTQSYTFYSTVNNNVSYSDISINVIQWDFSKPDYQRIVGTINIPEGYKGVNVAGDQFIYNNTRIKLDYNQISNISLDGTNRIKIKTLLTNTGSRSANLPAIKYYLITSDNSMYQMTQSNSDGLILHPKLGVERELTVEIPKALANGKMEIILASTEDQSKMDIPIATYELDMKNAGNEDAGESVPIGKEKEVIIGEYKYGITLQSVQRLPWEDDDLLTASVQITNKNNEAAPIPAINGLFYLDKVKLKQDSVKEIQVNNLLAIPVNGKVEFLMYTKIPFNNTMKNLGLDVYSTITNNGDSTDQVKLVNFEVSTQSFKSISKVAVNESKKMSTLGKSSTIKLLSVDSYVASSTRVYNVLVEAQNNEKRMTNLNKLAGYIKTTNLSFFPVKISEIKEKISPSGKALYSVYAKVPADFNTNGMTLVLGELIDNDSAYNNVTEFALPLESNKDVAGVFKDIPVYPYNLTINNIKINLTNNATVNFQYTLTKDQQYEVVPEGHSVVVELVDDAEKNSYSKTFELGQDLQLGSKEAVMVAEMNIENPNAKIQEIDGFTIKIYDQFEGHLKLLASRKVYTIYIP